MKASAAAVEKPARLKQKCWTSSMLDAATLPVESLAILADREGRRPVPIYQAHRWFARRFSSAFRAVLTAAKLDSCDDFWEAYYRGVDFIGDTVLDPFVGGGTSVVEAARLGATAIGVDIDPVACAITRFELHAADVPDLSTAVDALQQSVGSRMARYYKTTGEAGDERLILHAFWVQLVTCHQCHVTSEAHPHYQLAYVSEGTQQWAFCRVCHRVAELDREKKSFRCKACNTRTVIADGPVVHGRFACPSCSAEEGLIDVSARTGQPPTWRLFALETVSDGSNSRRLPMTSRQFQAATSEDQERLDAARRALGRRKTLPAGWRWIPDRAIPAIGRTDDRLIQYGYEKYYDLFNPRQLLHLSVLAEAINDLEGPSREALALAFSDHLTTNCMLTHYAFGWRRLAPLFSIRAYRHVCRPVEINPWLDGTGRGTFPNTARGIQRAVDFAQSPEVAHLNGGFVKSGSLMVAGAAPRSIHNGDSRMLAAIKDKSVDFILTDPPYCDNIAYSELSDFFLPWMQQFGLTPNTSSALSSNLAAQSRGAASVATFKDGLSECFVQMRRVLKDDGRLVFSYQHRTAEAWDALASALASGGWCPIQVFPLLGNSTAGLHQHEGTILWDAVTVCRKGPAVSELKELRISDAQVTAALKRTGEWAARLKKAKTICFRDADRENLLRAMLTAAALGTFGSSLRSKDRPLLDVLTKTL
jgi:putative DNA methylase